MPIRHDFKRRERDRQLETSPSRAAGIQVKNATDGVDFRHVGCPEIMTSTTAPGTACSVLRMRLGEYAKGNIPVLQTHLETARSLASKKTTGR
jgi:hypothetical protein